MKKKINFQEACQMWLAIQRTDKHLLTTDINYAVRVSLFAVLWGKDDVYHITPDELSALWDKFEQCWLGNGEELGVATHFLKTCLMRIVTIMNDWNDGKKRIDRRANIELPIYKNRIS